MASQEDTTGGDGLTPDQRRQARRAFKMLAQNLHQIHSAADTFNSNRALLGQAAEMVASVADARRGIEANLTKNSAEILRSFQQLADLQTSADEQTTRTAVAAYKAFNRSYRNTIASYFQLARKAHSSLLPPNWAGHVSYLPESLETMLLDEGLALAFVPSGAIVRQLFEAKSAADRRRIMGRNWEKIAHHCRQEIEGLTVAEAVAHGKFARSAIDAVLAGNSAAGQSLAANLLDTVIRQTFDGTSRKTIVGQKERIDLDLFHPTAAIVLGGVWGSFGEFWPDQGDVIPRRYSRHASAHAVGARQYTRVNAVFALMHVTSLLRLIDSGLEFQLED